MHDPHFFTNGEACAVSSVWRRAICIDITLLVRYQEVVEKSFVLKETRGLIYEAWLIVLRAIKHGTHGMRKYQELPVEIQTSYTCVAAILDYEPLFDMVISGKIGYTGIIRLLRLKGLWL